MKESEAWLKVAKYVHDRLVERPSGGFGAPGLCGAVAICVPLSARKELWRRMNEVYKPDVPFDRAFWWGAPSRNKRNDNARILGALFLRELVLDEERGKR